MSNNYDFSLDFTLMNVNVTVHSSLRIFNVYMSEKKVDVKNIRQILYIDK